MAQPRILIGMPAFQGVDHIQEALRSIAGQDYRDFRVLISIDANDAETAAACQTFLADPRFSLITQDRRLGWAGNINYLMSQPDYDFFCYWQHDDFTTPNYISELLRSAAMNPSAVCHYTGIQWFGEITDWMPGSSVTGLAVTRALSIFDELNGIPLRGLIRKDAIERTGPIRITGYESAFEEYVWIAKLAREGNLQCVEGPIYYKRARENSTHAKWHGKDRLWRRAVWIEFGMGMLETIWPVVRESERLTALSIVLDRLCLPKHKRFFFYDGPRVAFAADFLSQALPRFPVPLLQQVIADGHAVSFAGGVAGELLDSAIRLMRSGPDGSTVASTSFRFEIAEAGIDLLLDGWSLAEAWGTWSERSRAGLRLPVGRMVGRWKVVLTFQAFGAKRKPTIDVSVPAESRAMTWRVARNTRLREEFWVESRGDDVVLRFDLPDATSPKNLGTGHDRRSLGIALIALELTEPV